MLQVITQTLIGGDSVSRITSVPTFDKVLPGSGDSSKAHDSGSLYMQIVCRCTLLLAETPFNLSGFIALLQPRLRLVQARWVR
jgi:hypothetical protein